MENYQQMAVIGKGSFGRVTKIKRISDGKELVWKELQYGTMNEKEKQQIVAEVNILRELRHPCIVRYYDRIIDKRATKLYIVMEHCAGGDLATLIKTHTKNRTRAQEQFIWKVLGQVVSALKSCHRHTENGQSKPILHRDMKPANILLDKNMNAKLCDFGLATELAGTNKLAQTVGVGTPYYMSPELVNNQRYDERSDIWSVGCIIYELAALRPPFDAANQLALAVKINAGQYKRLPSQYTEELERTCGWMLRRDISRRPKVEDLERLPNLVLPLREARVGLKEIDLQNQHTKNNKKEEALAMKEKALEQREAELKEREAELKKWEERLEAQAANGVAPLGAALPPPPPVAAVASKKRDSSSFRIPHMADETAAARNDASSATRSKHVYSGGNERENVAPLVGKSGKVDFETYSKRRRVVNGAL